MTGLFFPLFFWKYFWEEIKEFYAFPNEVSFAFHLLILFHPRLINGSNGNVILSLNVTFSDKSLTVSDYLWIF